MLKNKKKKKKKKIKKKKKKKKKIKKNLKKKLKKKKKKKDIFIHYNIKIIKISDKIKINKTTIIRKIIMKRRK